MNNGIARWMVIYTNTFQAKDRIYVTKKQTCQYHVSLESMPITYGVGRQYLIWKDSVPAKVLMTGKIK